MMCIDQNTLTQRQARSLGKSSSLHNNVMPQHKPQCAWCLSEQDIEPGNGSHGICVQHAAFLLKQWRERNASRNQQYQSAIV
jgi:hypothetical protein